MEVIEGKEFQGGQRNDSWGVSRCHRGLTVSIVGAVTVAEFMRRRFIWAMRVVRFRPRRAAAPPTPPTRPPDSRRACSTCSRVRGGTTARTRFGRTAAGAISVAAGITGDVALSSAGEMRSTPREERMTARSMTFCSSRTLPRGAREGQGRGWEIRSSDRKGRSEICVRRQARRDRDWWRR